jgi:hypothetical protein
MAHKNNSYLETLDRPLAWNVDPYIWDFVEMTIEFYYQGTRI